MATFCQKYAIIETELHKPIAGAICTAGMLPSSRALGADVIYPNAYEVSDLGF
jgi:hypothetical protein